MCNKKNIPGILLMQASPWHHLAILIRVNPSIMILTYLPLNFPLSFGSIAI